ncbi:hypothetical protein [Paraburkholderia sp. 32]|uniref:hypothetical protein n=1 Tax=Paraburkholderia sp. 32 TaxID=2991057 RepID=UPI003D20BE11
MDLQDATHTVYPYNLMRQAPLFSGAYPPVYAAHYCFFASFRLAAALALSASACASALVLSAFAWASAAFLSAFA